LKKAGKGLVISTDSRRSGARMFGGGETGRNDCRQPEKIKEEEAVSFFRISGYTDIFRGNGKAPLPSHSLPCYTYLKAYISYHRPTHGCLRF